MRRAWELALARMFPGTLGAQLGAVHSTLVESGGAERADMALQGQEQAAAAAERSGLAIRDRDAASRVLRKATAAPAVAAHKAWAAG